MQKIKYLNLVFILCLFSPFVLAQEADLTDSVHQNKAQYVSGTFESTRVANGHSIEQIPKGVLDLRIGHRFGLANQGFYSFFGMDQATTCLALDYGIKDWLMVGLSRATLDKTMSGFTKLRLMRQSSGLTEMPVSVSVLLGTSIIGAKWIYPNRNNYFSSRISYYSQLIVARKLSETFSLQFSPIWIHRNLVPKKIDKSDMFALGFAGRCKITSNMSINGEYYPVISPSWNHQNTNYTNALSFGLDIETDGHVFQLLLTNSTGMNEKAFVTETTGNWFKGVHIGFNISRKFSLN